MCSARRWTQADLDSLDQRQRGHVSVPPPVLIPEARAIQQAKTRALHQKLEMLFAQHLTWTGMRSLFETQYRFDAKRKWRLDFYCVRFRLGVEIHGGTHSGGYHTRGVGFNNDREKLNAAAEQGITVLEFTAQMLSDGTAIAQTQRVLEARGWVKYEQPNV
jgi:very-short-patch-repair endonuclease